MLEDSLEGETFLGDGMSGRLAPRKEEEAPVILNMAPSSRPRSGRNRGMSGPISSNLSVCVNSLCTASA